MESCSLSLSQLGYIVCTYQVSVEAIKEEDDEKKFS